MPCLSVYYPFWVRAVTCLGRHHESMLPRSRFALACAALLAGAATLGTVSASADTGPQNAWHIDHEWTDIGPMIGMHGVPADADQTVMFNTSVEHSTDGGATWIRASNPCATRRMVYDPAPSYPDTLLAVCDSPQGALYRSTNAGASWGQVSLTDPNHVGVAPQFVAVAVSATAPYTVDAIAADPYPFTGTSTLYSSGDGGASWTTQAVPGFGLSDWTAMAVAPNDAQHVAISGYSTVSSAWTARVSHDGGATWASNSAPPMMDLTFDPSDSSRLLGSGNSVEESTDDGAKWAAPNGWPTGWVTAAAGALYVWSNSTISQSTDGGSTWRSASLTVPDTLTPQFEGLAIDPSDSKHLLIYDDNHLMTWSIEFDGSLPATSTFQAAVQNPASDITPISATLSASITPLFAGIDGFAQWNWSTGIGSPVATAQTMIPADPAYPAETLIPRFETHTITGLTPNTTYTVALSGEFRFPGGGLALDTAPTIQFTTPPAVPPSITRAPQAVLAAGQVQSGSVPVAVSWETSAGTYPVGLSTLGRRLGSTAWRSVGKTAKSSLASRASFGKSAQFRVQTGDGHGDLSPLTVGPKPSVSFKDDAGTAATWAGSWKQTKDATAVEKTLRTSASGAASVTLHFTGRSIAVIAPKGKHYAHFTAMLDGKSKGAVATSASALSVRRTIAIYHFANVGKHTLVLQVVRGSGHTLAALDGFVVLG